MMQTWDADLQLTPAGRQSVAGRTGRHLHGSVTYWGPGHFSDIRVLPRALLRKAGSQAFRSPGYGLYQSPEDPRVEGVQSVPVDQAGKTPWLKCCSLYQVYRAFFGLFYLEL